MNTAKKHPEEVRTFARPHAELYEALCNRGASYLATFVAGVKTTDMPRALGLVHRSDATWVSDKELRRADLHPETVRRHFMHIYGMTFHANQRLLRLNAAYQVLKSGRGVLDAGLEGKYESSNGLYRAYEQVRRGTLAQSRSRNEITLSHIDAPIGAMIAGVTDEGLCLLEFADSRML